MAGNSKILQTVLGLCFVMLTISTTKASVVECKYSEATSGSGQRFRVCVRALSLTSLEVTWSPDRGSSGAELGQAKKWLLTIAASLDRRRVVSFKSLDSGVSRYVFRSLSPGTEYYIFLDSVDKDGWYLTMTKRPITASTLTVEEAKTTTQRTVGYRGRGGVDEEGGRRRGDRTTSTQTTPRMVTEIGRKESQRGRYEGRGRGTTRRSTRTPEGGIRERVGKGAMVTETSKTIQRPDVGRRQTPYGRRSARTTRIPRERSGPITTKTLRTTQRPDVGRRQTPYGRRGSRTRIPTEIERKRRHWRVDERRRVIRRRTRATRVPVRPTRPHVFPTTEKRAKPSQHETTTSKATRTDNLPANQNSKVTTAFHGTTADSDVFAEGKLGNKTGTDFSNSTDQSKDIHLGNVQNRMVWWVFVTTGAGVGLFLALTLITVFTHRGNRTCKPSGYPHMEHEISQSSRSRSSSKLNSAISTADNIAATDSSKKKNGSKTTNLRNISENGYTRSPTSSKSRPLPPIIVSSVFGSVNTADGRTGRGEKTGSDTNERQEEGVYATVRDSLVTPDPTRVVSIISWGSEFDILEDPKDTVYGNISDTLNPDKDYGKLDTTYSNLSPTSSLQSPQQSAATAPPPSSSSTSSFPRSSELPSNPANAYKVPKPHPYAVPRRQTSSTSLVPQFLAPPPPPTSPSFSSAFALFHYQQQAPQAEALSPEQALAAATLPGLDLPKEKLQQLVMLLLSKSTETATADGNQPSLPASPTYLEPMQNSLVSRNT